MLSIAIACYEYNGKGVEVLEYSFGKMEIQTYKDFDVIIADHSIGYELEDLCERWKDRLNIQYYKNNYGRGLPAINKNFSIDNSDGDLIKILDQDDYLYDENSLQTIVNNFDDKTNWLVSSYVHTTDRVAYFKQHLPTMNTRIYVNNTIGSPSCLTIRDTAKLPYFDSGLIIAYDCDYYKQLYDIFGEPKIITDVTVVNYLWANQISASPNAQSIIDREFAYLIGKYET